MKKIIYLLTLIFPLIALSDSAEITSYLNMVANGQVQEVKAKLPDLMVESPNDPGVLLVLGVVLEDGFKAIDIYHKIVREYPDSEWADDAYWRIIQFYSLLGDTSKAREFLNDFKLRYSSSPYIANANEIVRMAVGLAKSDKKNIISSTKSEKSHKEEVSKDEEKQIDKKENIKESKKENKKEIPAKSKSKTKEETITAKKIDDVKKESETKKVDEKAETEAEDVKSDVAEAKEKSENNSSKDIPEELGKSGVYGLQVGVYKNKESAENEIKRFLKQRMRSELKPKQTKDGEMYAVVIGNYTSRESAEAAKAIVKQQCACDPIIYEK